MYAEFRRVQEYPAEARESQALAIHTKISSDY